MKAILTVLLALTLSNIQVGHAQTTAAQMAPNVKEDDVQAVFGNNLETTDPLLRRFLLAIAMERTDSGSNYINDRIGVPYIISATPDYWVTRLHHGDRSIDTLVNNALLLLFGDGGIDKAEEYASRLLSAAAQKGYWPAGYYVAEQNLGQLIDAARSSSVGLMGTTQADFSAAADATMKLLNQCANEDFAPCQFDIGFWLLGTENQIENGVQVLRKGIHTTLADRRYEGYVDQLFFSAIRAVDQFGEAAGIGADVRAKYLGLLEEYGRANDLLDY